MLVQVLKEMEPQQYTYVVGGNDDSFQRLNSNKIAMIDKDSIFGSWEWSNFSIQD